MSKSQREKGIIISYVTMAVNFAIGIVFTPFITRMLGQSEYGLYSLAASIIAYLSMLDLGFGNSMVRFTSKAKADGDSLGEKKLNGMFLVIFSLIGVVALITGIILYSNIENFFKTSFTQTELDRAKLIFLILLINICTSFPFTAVSALLSANERFAFLKMYTLISNVVKYALEAAVLFMGFKSVAIAVVSAGVSLFAKIVPIIYLKTKVKVEFSFKGFDNAVFKQILSYSSFIFINILVDQIYANTDKIILGKVAGTVAVAVYQVAANLNKDFSQFSTSISGVFLPNITQQITKKIPMSEISKTFIRIARIQFIILSLVFSGFLLFGKSFIHYWVGDKYADAYWITLIVMAPTIIPLSQNIGVSVLQALNRHRVRSVMYLFIALLNVGISIPLAIKWGGIGAAVGTAIGRLLGQILFMNWYYYKKVGLDIPRYWKNVFLRISAVTVPYAAVAYILKKYFFVQSIPALLIWIAAFVVGYCGSVWLLVLNSDEKKIITDKIEVFKRKIGGLKKKK